MGTAGDLFLILRPQSDHLYSLEDSDWTIIPPKAPTHSHFFCLGWTLVIHNRRQGVLEVDLGILCGELVGFEISKSDDVRLIYGRSVCCLGG